MPPTPTMLRAAAEEVRSVAGRIRSDAEPLADKGDHQTWLGPAATSYRRAAADIEDRAGTLAARLRLLARRLEERADELVEQLERERQREAERRLERQDRLFEASRQRHQQEDERRPDGEVADPYREHQRQYDEGRDRQPSGPPPPAIRPEGFLSPKPPYPGQSAPVDEWASPPEAS